MTGHKADPGVLDGITDRLRNASTDLDGVGKTLPESPDAGDATAAIAAILAQLSDNAGQLVIGLEAAATMVSDAKDRYVADDEAARATFERVQPPSSQGVVR